MKLYLITVSVSSPLSYAAIFTFYLIQTGMPIEARTFKSTQLQGRQQIYRTNNLLMIFASTHFMPLISFYTP